MAPPYPISLLQILALQNEVSDNVFHNIHSSLAHAYVYSEISHFKNMGWPIN